MTIREFAKRLQEGTARFNFSHAKEDSGDLQNARIYSPTLDQIFGDGSFKNAYEAAQLYGKELKSQGNRKTAIDRSIYSLATNIFSAALGTETFDEPGARAEGVEHDPRLRNSAYAIINPVTGEEVTVIWDFPYPEEDLSDDNLDKYKRDQVKYRNAIKIYNTEEFKKKYDQGAEANSKKLDKSQRSALTPEVISAVKTTQIPANLQAFKNLSEEWSKTKDHGSLEFVSDTLKGSEDSVREDIWHLDWAIEVPDSMGTAMDAFLKWIDVRLTLQAKANSAIDRSFSEYNGFLARYKKENKTIAIQNMEKNIEKLEKEKKINNERTATLLKAKEYAQAVNTLWAPSNGKVMRKIADPDKRETFKLK